MTASKSTKRPVPLAAQFLKLVGIILLLTFLVEWGILFITPQFNNSQWQLTVVNQFIERGATPLIGFVFIYTGFWIQAVSGSTTQPSRGNLPSRIGDFGSLSSRVC